jgi:ring-1,2-phenylacetyl-CoA epoxidase subunit PaaE
MLTYLLKVVEIRKETYNTVTFCFKQPGLKKIKYIPGQYLTLVVNINNRKYKRAYSLSSAPDIDQYLEVTVKRVTHGLVSNHLIDTLKVGDSQEVIEPLGDFIFDIDLHRDKQIYLWGAGSGITPLISILKSSLKNYSNKIVLTCLNKTEHEAIFLQQLLSLTNQYPIFSLNLVYTKQVVDGAFSGRITPVYIKNIIDTSTKKDDGIHFICGPAKLKNLISNTLCENAVKKQNIFSEEFEKVVSENELKDIKTEWITLTNNQGKSTIVEVVKGKSILEACLDLGLDLSYSCQTGNCKLCQARLKEGKVKIITSESIEGLEDDMHLLCCSYPLDSKVNFEI